MSAQELFPVPKINICPHAEYCGLHAIGCDNGFKHEECSNWSAMQTLAKRHREHGKYRAQCITCNALNIQGTDQWVHAPEAPDYSPNYPHVFCPACRPKPKSSERPP
jgi:hypothetical protein